MLNQIIIAKEKHGDRFYDASTPEAWAKNALKILTERWNEGYWYEDPDDDGLGNSEWADKRREEYKKACALTEEEIEALPEDARKTVLTMRKNAKRETEEDIMHRKWYEQAKQVVEDQDLGTYLFGDRRAARTKAGKEGRYERKVPKAWALLDGTIRPRVRECDIGGVAMSYCRVSERGSDVYVLRTMGLGQLECCGCRLHSPWTVSFSCHTTEEMLLHLRAHRWAGDKVPESAIKRLESERIENDRSMYENYRDRMKEKAKVAHLRKALAEVELIVFGKPLEQAMVRGGYRSADEKPDIEERVGEALFKLRKATEEQIDL